MTDLENVCSLVCLDLSRIVQVRLLEMGARIPSQTVIATTFQSWFSVEDEDARYGSLGDAWGSSEKVYKEFGLMYKCRGKAMGSSRTCMRPCIVLDWIQ